MGTREDTCGIRSWLTCSDLACTLGPDGDKLFDKPLTQDLAKLCEPRAREGFYELSAATTYPGQSLPRAPTLRGTRVQPQSASAVATFPPKRRWP
jgi:hypothetical protein